MQKQGFPGVTFVGPRQAALADSALEAQKFEYDKNMKKVFNWTNQLEHMGHPENYTKATPDGYKEEIAWVPMDFDPYSEEEKKKILEDNLKKGKK